MRIVCPLNENWLFVKKEGQDPSVIPEGGVCVNLPHSWNAIDGHDGVVLDKVGPDWSLGDLKALMKKSSYNRGSYWYYKSFKTPKQPLKGGKVYVEILAA